MAMMVKPICRALSSAACIGVRPFVHAPDDVLDHDHGVIDDEADRDGDRHQRQIVEIVAGRATSPRTSRPERRGWSSPGSSSPRNGAGTARPPEPPARWRRRWWAGHRRWRHGSASCGRRPRCIFTDGGIQCASCGSSAFTASTVCDHVGVGLLVDVDHHPVTVAEPAGELAVDDAVADLRPRRADGSAHRCARSTTRSAIIGRLEQLVVGGDEGGGVAFGNARPSAGSAKRRSPPGGSVPATRSCWRACAGRPGCEPRCARRRRRKRGRPPAAARSSPRPRCRRYS